MSKVKMRCPVCGKRVFDISKLPREPIIVATKCPQCKNFVDVPCTQEWAMALNATAMTAKGNTNNITSIN
ncbi:hypothetical protein LQZ18_02990 [Lachnospiraceae bacterium ZAX-1]